MQSAEPKRGEGNWEITGIASSSESENLNEASFSIPSQGSNNDNDQEIVASIRPQDNYIKYETVVCE